jgi:hypothetical protein
MTGTLRRVFEPIQIRGVEIPNRIARTGHLTKLGMGPAVGREKAYGDDVVLVTYKTSRSQLAAELAGRVPDVRLVGDALAARDLQVAIREGNDAARRIA